MTDKKNSAPASSCWETRIGKTIYRVTSVYLGEKDLKETLEHLAVQHALAEMEFAQATA